MAIGKVVCLSSVMKGDLLDVFMAEKPADWQVEIISPLIGDEKLAMELTDAEYLITVGISPVHPQVLEPSKKLKLIETASQGTEHLPVKWALQKGIPVANAGGANAIDVAEHVILLILACERHLFESNQTFREGKWRGAFNIKASHRLYGMTVGIVGFGNIGRRVANLAYAFGANIIYYEKMFIPYALRADTKAKPVTFDELLSQSDIVTLHVPSMTSTRKMINWEALTKMKPTACLINCSRGDIVDEAALLRALKEGKIAEAGLDVWDPEPPDPVNPLIHLPNVVATPHTAALTWEMWKPTFATMWDNVIRISEGKEAMNRILEF